MNRWITHMLLSLVLALVPLTALAQMGGDGGGKVGMMGVGMMGGGPEAHGMMGMPGMHGWGMEMVGMMDMMKMMRAVSGLDLTLDQKKKLQSLKLSHQKEAVPLFSKSRTTDLEIQELLMSEPVDMEKVKAKVREKHDALVKLDISHFTLMQRIKALLTPDQRQRMESMMMGEMMDMGPMMTPPMGPTPSGKGPDGLGDSPAKTGDPHGH